MLPLWPSIFLPESASLGTFVLVRARSTMVKTFCWHLAGRGTFSLQRWYPCCCFFAVSPVRESETDIQRETDIEISGAFSSKEHTDCTQTHDCTPSHNSNRFIKFADDTTVVGLISNRDETNYRSEVSRLAGWCSDNNLSLNVEKTKEIVVDFRRVHSLHAPLTINGATVERVSSTKFLGVHITEDLSWTNNTAALAKKAQQRLYFLRKLRRARAPAPIMCTFYRGTIESILTSCITVWYGTCNVSCRKSLQRIVRAAEKIVGVSLPSLQDIYNTRLTRKALSIAGDPTHPTHSFFSLLLFVLVIFSFLLLTFLDFFLV